jgi:hypothetical protein
MGEHATQLPDLGSSVHIHHQPSPYLAGEDIGRSFDGLRQFYARRDRIQLCWVEIGC